METATLTLAGFVIGLAIITRQERGEAGLFDDTERARPEHLPVIEPLNEH